MANSPLNIRPLYTTTTAPTQVLSGQAFEAHLFGTNNAEIGLTIPAEGPIVVLGLGWACEDTSIVEIWEDATWDLGAPVLDPVNPNRNSGNVSQIEAVRDVSNIDTSGATLLRQSHAWGGELVDAASQLSQAPLILAPGHRYLCRADTNIGRDAALDLLWYEQQA